MLGTEHFIARWPSRNVDYFKLVSKSASLFLSPEAPYLPPNFLFPSSVSAFTAPLSPYSPASSAATEHEEMARIKRPPKSITLKPRKCELCHLNRQSGNKPKSPVEKEEYFIDHDGTLTIKNGVCPRRLAIRLFTEVSKSGPKYEELLGNNIVKFLLNLQQIIDRHQALCPDEDKSHLLIASNVLKMYVTGSYPPVKERSSKSHDRHLNIVESAGNVPENVFSHLMSRMYHSVDDSSPIPDQTLKQGSHSTRLLSQSQQNLSGRLSPSVVHEASTLMDFEGSKGAASDKCSSEASSRVASPAPSLSSLTSGLSNTKRGTKILPVSSTDGQTRYMCPVCSLELSNDHELTVHIRSHNQTGQQSTPNTCTICKKTLSSQSSLDRHMLVHSGERPFKCKICDMSFTTNGNMHRHARIHEKNSMMSAKPHPGRKPSEAKQPAKKETPLVSAIIAGSPSMVNQPQFPGFFQEVNKPNFLDYYRNFVHPAYPTFAPPWYPDSSRYPFLMMEDVPPEILMPKRPRLSENVREPSPDLRSPMTYPCNVCSIVFTNQFYLDKHMEEHVIVDHHLEAEAGAACKTCKTVAKSEQSLLLHIMTHHKKEESLAEPDIKPGKKSPSSPSQSSSSSTIVSNNNVNISGSNTGFQELGFASFTCRKFPLIAKAFCESNPKVKGSKQPVFKCNECSKEFPVEGAKDLHEASHIHEEYTKCPKCDCHFTESSRLQEHMLKHVADVKFEQILDKSGLVLDNLSQNHFLAQFGLMPKEDNDDMASHEHNGEDDIKCEPASEDMKLSMTDDDEDDNDSLSSTHFLSAPSAKSRPLMSSSPYDSESEHDSLMPPTFPCKYCDKVLTSQQELKSHENSHKNFSQLQCRVCSYTSTDKSSLLRHMRTHSGERPFKCGICAYSFTTKANCERHMKQKHGLEKDQLLDNLVYNEYVINSKSDFPSSSKMHGGSSGTSQCKVCKVEFQQKQALELHMQSSPKCRLAFLCTLCMVCSHYYFLRSSSLSNSSFSLITCNDLELIHGLYAIFHSYESDEIPQRPFKSKSSAFNHILTVHPEVPSNLQDGYIIPSENLLSTHSIPALASPPPAHSKTPALSPYNLPLLDDLIHHHDKMSTHNVKPAVGLFHNKRLRLDVESADRPLDFSKPETKKVFEPSSHQRTLSGSFSEDDQLSEDVPIDLTVQRPSGSLSCRKSLNIRNQVDKSENGFMFTELLYKNGIHLRNP
ncbi:Ras-responsive element-binding protein 1 [Bulinus truncatus]|nr:Ras-responsive element-binding protein 1 [Bulinus truncatus]